MPKHNLKAIGFDFDDTLVISEDKKNKIFTKIFQDKYNITDDIEPCYIQLKGKKNRREKIEYIIHYLFDRDAKPDEVNELSKAFSKSYQQEMSTCPLVQCTNMLKELKEQVDFIFLLSLENLEDVKAVANHCGVADFFDEILGGPTPKLDNLKHILENHNLDANDVVYIGDSKNDILTSKELNLHAIGIATEFNYAELLKKLGAHFTFSSVCEIPYEMIINGDHK